MAINQDLTRVKSRIKLCISADALRTQVSKKR